MSTITRVVTWIAWGLFVATNLALLLWAPTGPVWFWLPTWMLSLGTLLVLLVRYNRVLAQWRAVLLIWLAYSGLRLLGVWFQGWTVPFVQANLGTFAIVLSLDAVLAGWFAIAALALRRDVSVAYVVIFFAVGAVLMLALVRSAGGVLNFLTSSMTRDASTTFSPAEPILMALSCMSTLGFLTFLPHLLWLGIRELRGR
jgi:hypothetical protein